MDERCERVCGQSSSGLRSQSHSARAGGYILWQYTTAGYSRRVHGNRASAAKECAAKVQAVCGPSLFPRERATISCGSILRQDIAGERTGKRVRAGGRRQETRAAPLLRKAPRGYIVGQYTVSRYRRSTARAGVQRRLRCHAASRCRNRAREREAGRPRRARQDKPSHARRLSGNARFCLRDAPLFASPHPVLPIRCALPRPAVAARPPMWVARNRAHLTLFPREPTLRMSFNP